MAKIALLIGVSNYQSGFPPLPGAINDIKAMQRVLEHSELGGFNEVKLLENPDSKEMGKAIESLFPKECNQDDLRLLFFSGHGIKDDSGKLYFATHDTNKHSDGSLSKATAVSASFIHDILNSCLICKRKVVILDCCYSGAFAEGLTLKDIGTIDIEKELGGKGRAILTSSSSTEYSYEDTKVSDLSIYTNYVVEGIETGKADLNQDGRISVDELHQYVYDQVKKIRPVMNPKIDCKSEGFNIAIAKTKAIPIQLSVGKCKLAQTKHLDGNLYEPEVPHLPNFLEENEVLISELTQRLESDKLVNNLALENQNTLTHTTIDNRILDIIRCSSKADCVFVLQHHHKINSENEWTEKSRSNFSENVDQAYIDTLKASVLSAVSYKSIFNTAFHGVYLKISEDKKRIPKVCILAPLQIEEKWDSYKACKYIVKGEFIVVCGIEENSPLFGDAYGQIIASFYRATQRLLPNCALIEASILDDVKQAFGFVAPSLYKRRLDLFKKRLEGMIVHFEPMLDIRPGCLAIKRWEALARDPVNLKAPVDLFRAAEMWGVHFSIELDKYFLKKAIHEYRLARIRAKGFDKPQDVQPLSINVYPGSIMSRAYFTAVQEAVLDALHEKPALPPEQIILEISEKTALPIMQSSKVSVSPLQDFRNRVLEYTHKTGVRFAIDDFGVGYSSISRLAGLNLPYVKIDREILDHPTNEVIIRFVLDMVKVGNANPPDVIVEGVDEQVLTKISLSRLAKIGVSFVQGHLFGKAGSEIYRFDDLDEEKKNIINNHLLED